MIEQHERTRSQAKRREKSEGSGFFNKTGIIPKVESDTLLTERKNLDEEPGHAQRRGAIKMKWQLNNENE